MAQIVKPAHRKSASDHALAVIKAGLNAVPYVGGPIASLIGDYVPTSTQRAAERTIELLAEKLTAMEGRIDVEQVNKEEFAELFKSCYLVVMRSHREEKLRAVAALMANLLLRPGDRKNPHMKSLITSYDVLMLFRVAQFQFLARRTTSRERLLPGRKDIFNSPN
jgi:hypothetical protein